MLGSLAEADDVLQEAWLRIGRSDTSDVEDLGGWFTTIVARLSLNVLRARRAKREERLEGGIPDPIVSPPDRVDPEHEALIADSVGLALLIVLDSLAPAERLAFMLHDMFAPRSGSRADPRSRSVSERALSFRHLALRARPVLVNGGPGAFLFSDRRSPSWASR
jgi:RNA polymerase sigma-70 factor (ECF subfamily)